MAKVEVVKSEKANRNEFKNENVPNNNTPTENSNNQSKVGAIISLIVIVALSVGAYFYINTGNYHDSYGEGIATKDIVDSVLIGSSVTANELKCEANSKTDDEIKLVKCTTTKNEIIKEYGSSTIWYGYLETVDGGYYHYISKSKDTVLSKLRQK